MSIVNQLTSQAGDRSEKSNLHVARQCLDKPELLYEIIASLTNKDVKLVGDCAEVLCEAARQKPDLIVPLFDHLIPLIQHKNTRIRWESMHAISFIAHLVPDQVIELFPALQQIIKNDGSIIVRDYAIDTIGNYAALKAEFARKAYPFLLEALQAWDGRHAGRVLDALSKIVDFLPDHRSELIEHVKPFENASKKVVQKNASRLLKLLSK